MIQLDERSIERLAHDSDSTTWEIGFDLTGAVSPGRLTERCNVLIDAEFLEREDRDLGLDRIKAYWSITMWGGSI